MLLSGSPVTGVFPELGSLAHSVPARSLLTPARPWACLHVLLGPRVSDVEEGRESEIRTPQGTAMKAGVKHVCFQTRQGECNCVLPMSPLTVMPSCPGLPPKSVPMFLRTPTCPLLYCERPAPPRRCHLTVTNKGLSPVLDPRARETSSQTNPCSVSTRVGVILATRAPPGRQTSGPGMRSHVQSRPL